VTGRELHIAPAIVDRVASPLRESASILGVRVHAVTMSDVVARLEAMVTGTAQHRIIPVNPEMVMAAQSNEPFREAINTASLVLPDGIGVVLAARLFGREVPERVTGVDTVMSVAELASRRKLRIFFLGAAPGIAGAAAARLEREFPGLTVAGTYAGSPEKGEEEEICRRISESRADILLIAYGAPRQELWVARNLAKLPVRIAVCVGGTFDFLAGVVTRAPRWVRSVGLEWLYRLTKEPRRWRRMLALPKFAAAVIIERLSARDVRP
jgi:N-acetylglucosaminyldiphosphoundecaprenol N-acetyl-beta-D-mannosaminyltransferase